VARALAAALALGTSTLQAQSLHVVTLPLPPIRTSELEHDRPTCPVTVKVRLETSEAVAVAVPTVMPEIEDLLDTLMEALSARSSPSEIEEVLEQDTENPGTWPPESVIELKSEAVTLTSLADSRDSATIRE